MTLLTLLQSRGGQHGARTMVFNFPGAIRLYSGSVIGAFILLLILPG